jgi:hypothetical protein
MRLDDLGKRAKWTSIQSEGLALPHLTHWALASRATWANIWGGRPIDSHADLGRSVSFPFCGHRAAGKDREDRARGRRELCPVYDSAV